MKDIEIAKKHLEANQELTLVIVKNGEIVLESKEKGIQTIYSLAKERNKLMEGSAIADKVIGRFVAIIYEGLKIDSLYGRVVSELALDILDDTAIHLEYKEKVPFIKHKNETEMGELERVTLKYDTLDELILDFERVK